jgi:hypothetical protein
MPSRREVTVVLRTGSENENRNTRSQALRGNAAPTLCVVGIWDRSKRLFSDSLKRARSLQDRIPTQSVGTS